MAAATGHRPPAFSAFAACGSPRRRLLGRLLLGAAALLGSHALAANPLCLHGCPTGAPATNQTVARTLYVLSNNGDTKFADWVAYRITHDTIGSASRRKFSRDPDLPAATTLSPPDYRGAREALGVDHGHQAPLVSFSNSPDWDETNYLSNVAPRRIDLNEGPWRRLESAERNLAGGSDTAAVYSVTGPIYGIPMPNLPQARQVHSVPAGYWKVIAVEHDGTLRTAAFIMPQNLARGASHCGSLVTVREVERRTGLKLFPDMPADRRSRIEDAKGDLAGDLGCDPPAVEIPNEKPVRDISAEPAKTE